MLKENIEMFNLTNVLEWRKDNLGEGCTIVVLDEGHESNHFEYVKGNMEVPVPYRVNDKDHGAVTVAVGYQIAPNVRVVYMDFNCANTATREEMIDWIMENKENIDVINISLNFRKSIVDRYTQRLEESMIPIVVAVGNEGEEDGIEYPAKYPYTIAVGAYSPNGGGSTSYSNQGKELDCLADAGTYYPNSFGKPVSQFGTSFSSPNVAYSLALYFSWRKRNNLPKLTPKEVRKFIKDNSLDLYEEGHDYKSGFGLFRLPNEIPVIVEKVEKPKEEDSMNKDYFSDDDGKWHEKFNNELAALGILDGDGEGNFRPNDNVTRAELSKVASVLRTNILDEVRKMLGK